MSRGKSALLYADGACLGNPGPAGAGYVITHPDGSVVTQGSVPLGQGTNNSAEYHAVIAGLQSAAHLGYTDVTVRSDSELLCKQMWGQYRVKDPKLKRLHSQVRRLMDSFQSVRFEQIPRQMNSPADRLAVQAARQALSSCQEKQLELGM